MIDLITFYNIIVQISNIGKCIKPIQQFVTRSADDNGITYKFSENYLAYS